MTYDQVVTRIHQYTRNHARVAQEAARAEPAPPLASSSLTAAGGRRRAKPARQTAAAGRFSACLWWGRLGLRGCAMRIPAHSGGSLGGALRRGGGCGAPSCGGSEELEGFVPPPRRSGAVGWQPTFPAWWVCLWCSGGAAVGSSADGATAGGCPIWPGLVRSGSRRWLATRIGGGSCVLMALSRRRRCTGQRMCGSAWPAAWGGWLSSCSERRLAWLASAGGGGACGRRSLLEGVTMEFSSPRFVLGSGSSGESLDLAGSGNDVVSTTFPPLGRCFEDR